MIGTSGIRKRGRRLAFTAGVWLFAGPALAGPSCVVPGFGDDPETRARLIRTPASSSEAAASARLAVPSVGSVRLLVILAEFADKPHRIEPARFEELLFGPGPAPSVADYYTAVSGGRLSLHGDVFGWVTLPQTQFYYSQNEGGIGSYPNNGQRLAEDAVLAAIASAGLDLAPYDSNGDRIVDALLVIHSGQGFEWAGTSGPSAFSTDPDPSAINSHKWSVRNSTLQANAAPGRRLLHVPRAPVGTKLGLLRLVGLDLHDRCLCPRVRTHPRTPRLLRHEDG